MPIYEYVCQACGRETEIIHGISEPSPKECPACGKPKLTKLVSAAGFRLKGGGWYETDFKPGARKDAGGEGAKSDSAGGESKTESKSESGPAVIAPKAGVRPAPKSAVRSKAKPAAKPAKKPARKAAQKRPEKKAAAKKAARGGKGGRKR